MGGIPLLILPVDKINFSIKNPCSKPYYNKKDIDDIVTILKMCDGFIITGGDVWYQLDEVVINYAIDKDIPLLAICLGMQALSKVLSGNKAIAYDNTIKNNTFINHNKDFGIFSHVVNIKKESLLYSIILKDKIKVNSRHSYHTPYVPTIFVSSCSKDNIVESIELKNKKFIIGVQWHPELLIDFDINSRKIFEAFIEKSLENSQNFHKKMP